MEREADVIQTTRAYFDKNAKDYDNSSDGRFVRCMYREILEKTMALKPDTVLDLGCGNGNILVQLAQTGSRLYGLDLSSNMIAEAERRLGGRASLTVGDAQLLPYGDESFDLVICNASFHHYPRPDTVLEEIRRVLKPRGVLILGDPTAPAPIRTLLNIGFQGRDSGDFKIYGKKELYRSLENHGFMVKSWKMVKHHAFVLTAGKR